MDIFSLREYFDKYIKVMSLSMAKDKQLVKKEISFLVECCVFNSQGGNLNDFDALWEYFKPLKFFKRRNDCSTYKKKLGEKVWVKGKRNVFKLPKGLDILVEKDHFLVFSGDKRVKVKSLGFNVGFTYKPPAENLESSNLDNELIE